MNHINIYYKKFIRIIAFMTQLNYRILFTLTFCLQGCLLQAQSYQKHLNNTKEELAYFNSIIQTEDSGFLICTNHFLGQSTWMTISKYDVNFNQLLWQKKIHHATNVYDYASEIRPTKDKGFVLCAYSEDSFITKHLYMKFDACGEREWSMLMHDSDFNYPTSFIQLDNGDYLATSADNLYRYGLGDASTIFIYDSAMNLKSNYSIMSADFLKLNHDKKNIYLSGIMVLPDLDSNLECLDTNTVTEKFLSVQLDSRGQLEWFTPQLNDINYASKSEQIIRHPNGNLYNFAVQSADSGLGQANNQLMLVVHDTLGRTLKTQIIVKGEDSKYWNIPIAIANTADNNFIALSHYSKVAYRVGYTRVDKIDTLGKLIDSLIIGDGVEDYVANNIQPTYDANFVVLINVRSLNDFHTYVMKIDQNLKVVNTDTMTSHLYDKYCSTKPTSADIYLDKTNTPIRELIADSSMVYHYICKGMVTNNV
ncbi:MAG: hypothetical protein HYZ42_04430, partial [Bacteroidetes bacterium]|nr:hypothetical protein [Bacteroidota bacterium]